jgi:uncharacterized protein YdaU (DUF1376 family)
MSSNDKWMPLYVADYLGDTMHLTTLQHGAYVLLLMHYWRTGPLPNDPDELAAIVKLDPPTWGAVWVKLSGFFTVNGDGTLHQKRMDWERRRWTEISEKRRDAGKRGAEAKYRTRPTEGCGPIQPQSDAQPTVGDAPGKTLANATDLPDPASSKPHGKPMANAIPLPCDLPQRLPPQLPEPGGNCQTFATRFASVPLPPQKGIISSYLGKEAPREGAREGNARIPEEEIPESPTHMTRDVMRQMLASLPPSEPTETPERNHTPYVQMAAVAKPNAPKACPLVGDHLAAMRKRAGIGVGA